MTTQTGGWIWYELMTTDTAAAADFYGAVVGWTVTAGSAENPGYSLLSCPDGGMAGGMLQLSQDMQDHGARPGWFGYLSVADCDAAMAKIVAAGGKELMPPRDVPMAGRIAMAADCCGAAVYVMTPTPPPGGGESTAFSAMPRHGRCGWNELLAGNAGRAIAFYTGQFGWSLPEPMDMGEMGQYQFVAHDGVTMGAIMVKPAAVPMPTWCHYFWVPGIDAAITALKARGGHVVNGPMPVPGELWIVQAIDPQGALFSLVSDSK